MTQAPTTRTHCPTCGAKLARQDMSNCPYCSTPFALVEKVAESGGESPHRERLRRLAEKDEARALLEWTPPESIEWYEARRRGNRGLAVAGLGVLLLIWRGVALGPSRDLWLSPWAWIGLVLFAWGLVRYARSVARRRELTAAPLLKRAAIVLDRRSVTEIHGGRGKTAYYFKLELADGTTGEFRWPGRGAAHEPIAVGVTGIAYTRGDELLDLQRVRG